MDKEEAARIWNLDKCERCEAMETRLRACLLANESLAAGLKRAEAELRSIQELVKAIRKGWGQA